MWSRNVIRCLSRIGHLITFPCFVSCRSASSTSFSLGVWYCPACKKPETEVWATRTSHRDSRKPFQHGVRRGHRGHRERPPQNQDIVGHTAACLIAELGEQLRELLEALRPARLHSLEVFGSVIHYSCSAGFQRELRLAALFGKRDDGKPVEDRIVVFVHRDVGEDQLFWLVDFQEDAA